jgi:hypothetical protein
MLAVSDIRRMSPVERLQTMELLWKSLSESADEISSPPWHGRVLSERMSKVTSGQGTFLTIPELKMRLNKTAS